MKKLLKILSIFFLLFTALNALIAGFLFIIKPTGYLMGMTTDYLEFAPFASFLIPGIVLFVVNGLMNVIVAIFTIMEKYRHYFWIMIQGVLLCGWIIAQVIMVRDINALHIIMFSIGLVLMICGYMLYGKTNRISGN